MAVVRFELISELGNVAVVNYFEVIEKNVSIQCTSTAKKFLKYDEKQSLRVPQTNVSGTGFLQRSMGFLWLSDSKFS